MFQPIRTVKILKAVSTGETTGPMVDFHLNNFYVPRSTLPSTTTTDVLIDSIFAFTIQHPIPIYADGLQRDRPSLGCRVPELPMVCQFLLSLFQVMILYTRILGDILSHRINMHYHLILEHVVLAYVFLLFGQLLTRISDGLS